MDRIDIKAATEHERNQAAMLLAQSEPWITLGITLDQCKKTCCDPEFFLYMAHIKTKLSRNYPDPAKAITKNRSTIRING